MDIILDSLDPALASQKLVELSVQYASLVSKLAEAEVAYNRKMREYYEAHPELPANKVNIHAKGGELYGVLRKLQAEEKGTLEIIRSLKKFVRIKEQEFETSRNL
jgi:uncharacterized protein involved in exopolysaccharide biosynthesis